MTTNKPNPPTGKAQEPESLEADRKQKKNSLGLKAHMEVLGLLEKANAEASPDARLLLDTYLQNVRYRMRKWAKVTYQDG